MFKILLMFSFWRFTSILLPLFVSTVCLQRLSVDKSEKYIYYKMKSVSILSYPYRRASFGRKYLLEQTLISICHNSFHTYQTYTHKLVINCRLISLSGLERPDDPGGHPHDINKRQINTNRLKTRLVDGVEVVVQGETSSNWRLKLLLTSESCVPRVARVASRKNALHA